jgi:hypothetical protein
MNQPSAAARTRNPSITPKPGSRTFTLGRNALGAGILGLLVGACSGIPGIGTTGSGTLRTESRDVSGFSTVELTGVGDVIIEQTGTESLSIQAEDNLLPELTSDVSGGTLRLGSKTGAAPNPTRAITYRVTTKNLSGLRLSGSGSETATKIGAGAIAIDISGSGDITTEGTADSQTITISGSGNYRAGKLTTKSSSVQISGSGDATLNVRDTLTADLRGSGNVNYTGNAHVSQTNSGSGELRKE